MTGVASPPSTGPAADDPAADDPRSTQQASAAPSSTATGPTVRSTARSARGPLLVTAGLVLVGVVLGLLATGSPGGRLDVASYAPGGARAVAELLRDRGVQVDRVETVAAVQEAAGPGVTLVIPRPEALAAVELERLAAVDAALLVVGPDQQALDGLGLAVDAQDGVDVDDREPACDLPAARVAGEVQLGGTTYEADGAPSVGCYASGGRATLLQLTEQRVTLLGDGALLTNDELGDHGHAALALGLLADSERVLWLVPRPGREVAGDRPPLSSLIPDAVVAGSAWLFVVAAVLALSRARRLGRVVEEPLPVVVRAAEAVEGRARLYRASGARETAAEALRTATRERVVRRVGLPLGAERPAVVRLLAERTGGDPAALDALLYGGAPVDDPALVRLADDLRSLEASLAPAP